MGKKEKQAKEKPLEKMTAPELREIAKQLPDITGASGMNKAELISVIKKARGIEESGRKKKSDVSMRDIKAKIRELKNKRQEFLEKDDKKMADIFRRRISRLKKKTRRAA
jgi:protein-arginine kinase activator protein McsA